MIKNQTRLLTNTNNGHTSMRISYWTHSNKSTTIGPDQKSNIRFPSPQNKNPIQIKNGNLAFEYEAKIDFAKLNERIEDEKVQGLNISTKSPIFLEIKRIFEIILKNPVSVMDGWKYKSTFIHVDETHFDAYKHRKPTFVNLEWMDSFVLSFIFCLYH